MNWPAARAVATCATSNARARWWEPLIHALVTALTMAVVGAGLLTALSIPASYTATKQRLNAPDLWVGTPAGPSAALYQRTGGLPQTAGLTPIYPVQAGVVRLARNELRAAISPLPASPPEIASLTIVSGAWPAPGSQEALVEWGAAGSLRAGLDSSLTLVGGSGSVGARVAGLVRDTSRAAYPLSSPAAVYVTDAVWLALGGEAAAQAAQFGVRIKDRGHLRAAASAIRGLAPAGTSLTIVGGSAVVDGLAPLTLALEGFLVLFGMFGLAASVAFILGTTRAELIRQSRSIGILRATGWSADRVRTLHVIQRGAPALIGTVVGGGVAVLLAGWMTDQVAELMGLDANVAFAGPLLVGIGALIVLCTVAAVLLATRDLGRRSPAATIGAGYRQPPSRLAGSLSLGRGGLAPRLGAALLLGRPGRAGTAVAVLILGLVTVVFSVVTEATLADFGTQPATWGYAYDWRVDFLKGLPAGDVEAALSANDGVAAGLAVYDRNAMLADTRAEARFVRADQNLIRYHLLAGHAIRSESEVLLGAALASATGLAPGRTTVLRLGDAEATVTVAGVYRELDNLGQVIGARDSLLLRLQPDATPDYFLARLVPGADAAIVKARLESALSGRVVITSVRDQIAVPLSNVFQTVLLLLGFGLALVAGMVMLAMTMILADEHAFVVGILKAIGAGRRQLAASLAWAAAFLMLPALCVALPVGLLLTLGLIRGLSAVIGGVDPVVPGWGLMLGLLVAMLAPASGFLLPAADALRESPAGAIAMER